MEKFELLEIYRKVSNQLDTCINDIGEIPLKHCNDTIIEVRHNLRLEQNRVEGIISALVTLGYDKK